MTLHIDSTLQGGRYRILSVLGQGGFGITYLAEQTLLDGKVAIKEFFMKGLCVRDESTSRVTLGTSCNREMVEKCRQKFLKEARTIFKLKHPNIVRILDVFEENDTAYYVMEYIQGESLADMVKRRGPIPEAEALGYIAEVGKALKYIHDRKINHLDIKPSNIMRRKEDGRIMLIDFGVSKQYDLVTSEGTSTTPVGISRGYSPAEQYRQHGVQTFSPQSDVYSLAATLYKLLTGVTPPEAIEVQDDGLPLSELQSHHISSSVIDAIQRAMKGRNERTQSTAAFLSDLGCAVVGDYERGEMAYGIGTHVVSREPMPKLLSSIKITIIIAALVLIVVSVFFLGKDKTRSLQSQLQTPLSVTYSNGVLTCNDVSYTFKQVEGGTFMMGADPDSIFADNPHEVTLSTYSIGETEVTQELWEAVMGINLSWFKGPKRPVEHVSWTDCQDFIKKLNEKTGQNFRLPTEAEWEYAARGGNKSKGYVYSGGNELETVAGCYKIFRDMDDSSPDYGTHDVATKRSNELGLYDMSGNVWEWCQDWYAKYSLSPQTNPLVTEISEIGAVRVIRGGCWIYIDEYSNRISNRLNDLPYKRSWEVGFRLALSE